jgi:hypothetical protein
MASDKWKNTSTEEKNFIDYVTFDINLYDQSPYYNLKNPVEK